MTPPTIASTAAITITPVRFGEDRPYSLVMDSHLVNMPAARARVVIGRRLPWRELFWSADVERSPPYGRLPLGTTAPRVRDLSMAVWPATSTTKAQRVTKERHHADYVEVPL